MQIRADIGWTIGNGFGRAVKLEPALGPYTHVLKYLATQNMKTKTVYLRLYSSRRFWLTEYVNCNAQGIDDKSHQEHSLLHTTPVMCVALFRVDTRSIHRWNNRWTQEGYHLVV